MTNSIKLPVAALAVALLFSVFTFGSIVTRRTLESASGAAVSGDVANAPYGGSKFYSQAAAQQVPVAADPTGGLKWDKAEYTATAGDVTFTVANPSPVQHQFGVEGAGINYQSGNLGGGTTVTLTIKGLPPGEYQLVCNFPGHKAGGMVAKLTVTGDGGASGTPGATPGTTGTPGATPTR